MTRDEQIEALIDDAVDDAAVLESKLQKLRNRFRAARAEPVPAASGALPLPRPSDRLGWLLLRLECDHALGLSGTVAFHDGYEHSVSSGGMLFPRLTTAELEALRARAAELKERADG